MTALNAQASRAKINKKALKAIEEFEKKRRAKNRILEIECKIASKHLDKMVEKYQLPKKLKFGDLKSGLATCLSIRLDEEDLTRTAEILNCLI